MGVIFSRKKKKSTKEKLEQLEKDIRKIEEFRQHTEQKQKRTAGKLLLYGIPLYGFVALAIYLYEFPTSFVGKILAVTPLLILPILFVLLRRFLSWYFRRQITHNEEKLSELYAEKKKILEDVMETETYKVAKEILEKFAPDQLRNKDSPNGNQGSAFPQSALRTPGFVTPEGLRRRIIPGTQSIQPTPMQHTPMQHTPMHPGPRAPMSQRISPPGLGAGRGAPRTPMPSVFLPPNGQQAFARGVMMRGPPGPPMPRPIPPYERSFLDRMVEYLVGDGPNNRYALICRQCESHNGMALREEFEYLAFRCCYCYHWNPARKQRPHAPRLPTLPPPGSPETRDKEAGGEEESGSEEEGSEESSSDVPPGESREGGGKHMRESEEDACSDSGDAVSKESKEESSRGESLMGAEDMSEGVGQEATGSEATPASSSSVSPSTEEGSGGDPNAVLEGATSADSGTSSKSPVSVEQEIETELVMLSNPLES